jgi:hypothetical protein
MGEFGPPSLTADGGLPGIGGQIAVDATSSVTLVGMFSGPVDGPHRVGYVLRIDAGGNVVFSHTYPLKVPTLLGVQPDGSASILFLDYGALGCAVAGTCDGGGPEAGIDYYSLVQLDGAGTEVGRHSLPWVPGLLNSGTTPLDPAVDPAGLLWGLGFDDAGPALQRFTQSGVPLWSQPVPGGANLALGPAGGVVYAYASTSPPTEQFGLFGFDGGASWSRLVPLATAQPGFGDMVVDSTGTIYAAGQVDPRVLAAGDAHWPSDVVGVEVLDPLGHPKGIRAWAGGVDDFYATTAIGVDPSGNAVIGGYSSDADGGYSLFMVKLGP